MEARFAAFAVDPGRNIDGSSGAQRCRLPPMAEQQKACEAAQDRKDDRQQSRAKFALESVGLRMQNEALQNLTNAKTPQEVAGAAERIRIRRGKERAPCWKSNVVLGVADVAGNKLPSYVALVNESTGESRIVETLAQNLALVLGTSVGTVSEVNRRRATWNGQKAACRRLPKNPTH